VPQLLALLLALVLGVSPLHAEEMPHSFVYLRDIDPTIRQDIRYAGSGNFTGRRVPGYEAPECLLVREAAEALRGAHAELKKRGLSLEVYDCYRPARAVDAFVAWAKEPDDPEAKARYYPRLAKRDLFPDYIASVSGHSRGATVDLTVVPADATVAPTAEPDAAEPRACTRPGAGREGNAPLEHGHGLRLLRPKGKYRGARTHA
jgi:D-alanyl-D-alanine dipeptidase